MPAPLDQCCWWGQPHSLLRLVGLTPSPAPVLGRPSAVGGWPAAPFWPGVLVVDPVIISSPSPSSLISTLHAGPELRSPAFHRRVPTSLDHAPLSPAWVAPTPPRNDPGVGVIPASPTGPSPCPVFRVAGAGNAPDHPAFGLLSPRLPRVRNFSVRGPKFPQERPSPGFVPPRC